MSHFVHVQDKCNMKCFSDNLLEKQIMLFDFMAIVNSNASSKYDTNIYLLPS